MTEQPPDAFVFFGATGDLAFRQIFPARRGLSRDEEFDVPIIIAGSRAGFCAYPVTQSERQSRCAILRERPSSKSRLGRGSDQEIVGPT